MPEKEEVTQVPDDERRDDDGADDRIGDSYCVQAMRHHVRTWKYVQFRREDTCFGCLLEVSGQGVDDDPQ